ncbi:Protein-tyrosine-phosphatase MKP1 [Acorus gramineus]|uniref:Protein-tyrosine-phosphatase MKP1 n=1 Tax=Acorus gramineus TaxID=55184 RepID=A0AAV9AM25_ACOGR|nr:Protein-tyrosine-phosphatase MKP1 [Acorus gramineus]
MVGDDESSTSSSSSASQRRSFLRSASWSASRSATAAPPPLPSDFPSDKRRFPPVPLTPRSSQPNSKPRSSLPPLSISRRSLDEWPRAGSDDLGEWAPHGTNPPSTPTAAGRRDTPGKIACFDKECSKVADHVYLGGDSVARNRDILRRHGITHVLNCVGFVCPEYFKSDLVYKTLWLQDSPSEDITSILYDVFDYFEDVRSQAGRVLVHCCQGVSRSTSLVIAYLMWREGQSFDDAFQFVKAARGIANPNMGFACQLLQCQKRVHAIPLSPSSVLRVYRMAPHSPYDPLHLVPKTLVDPSPASLDSRGAFIVHAISAIYIWVGKECEQVMERDAKAAALQVVRYERVQGPVETVAEGEEPREFWEAFLSVLPSAEDRERVESATKICPGKRRVESYNVDFEMLSRAIKGGVVPSGAGGGHETRVPSRESNWSVLRRKLASGGVKEWVSAASRAALCRVYSDSMLGRDSVAKKGLGLPLEPPAAPDSYHSPSSLSSDLSSCSKGSSCSPSSSPSTPPSLEPSPILPDPSKLTSKPSLLAINGGLDDALRPRSQTNSSPSKKSFSASLAERRGSFSTTLKLPTLSVDAASSLPRSVGGRAVDNTDDVPCANKVVIGDGLGGEDGVGTAEACGGFRGNHTSRLLDLVAYSWPDLNRIQGFCASSLDSRSVFILLPQRTGSGEDKNGLLYLWVGSSYDHVSHQQCQVESGNDVGEAKEVDWNKVAYDFLSIIGLPKDTTIKVIREQEPNETREFLSSLCCPVTDEKVPQV